MLDVDFQSDGADRLLRGMGDRLSDADRLLGVLTEDLQEYEQEAFKSAGHGQWAPNNPITIAIKGHDRVLVDSGGLLAELTSDSAISIRGDDLTLESRLPYARYLKAGSRGMPRRDPVPEPDASDVRGWADQLLGFIVDGRRR